MRLIFRILSLLLLSIAVISAVIDAARSLSASTLVLTSLAKGWGTVAPVSLMYVQKFVEEKLPAMMSDPGFTFLLNMPAAAVFAVLAALFYAIGAKRQKPFGQIGMR